MISLLVKTGRFNTVIGISSVAVMATLTRADHALNQARQSGCSKTSTLNPQLIQAAAG